MIFYSGWIILRPYFYDTDDLDLNFEAKQNEMLTLVNELIAPLKRYDLICELKKMNWSIALSIMSEFNHDNGYKDEIIALFEKIGACANGSYGLLYIRDMDSATIDNEFQVFRLARGRLDLYKDNFLSPCNPVIEV